MIRDSFLARVYPDRAIESLSDSEVVSCYRALVHTDKAKLKGALLKRAIKIVDAINILNKAKPGFARF